MGDRLSYRMGSGQVFRECLSELEKPIITKSSIGLKGCTALHQVISGSLTHSFGAGKVS